MKETRITDKGEAIQVGAVEFEWIEGEVYVSLGEEWIGTINMLPDQWVEFASSLEDKQ